MALVVKNLPAKAEEVRTWVRFLGWEKSLEEGTATHSSTLAWRIPRSEEPGRLQPRGSQSWKRLRRLSRAWDNRAALAKTSIKSHTNHFFAVMGTIKIQSLRNSELYNTWLSIITTLCMRSPGIIYLIASRYQNWHLNKHLDDSYEASVLAKMTREGRYWLRDRIASSSILWARKGHFPKRTALSWVFLMRRAVRSKGLSLRCGGSQQGATVTFSGML